MYLYQRTALLLLQFLVPMLVSSQSVTLPARYNLEPIGHLSYAPRTLAGCWHYVDGNGSEWALVGTSTGMSIVDISNPALPIERFIVPGRTSSWRELRTWNGYAYVGSEADSSGITIVDLNSLPDTINWKVWRGDIEHDGLLRRSHTVQTKDGYLYIFGGGNVTNGCTIADLSDPWNPAIVGTYTTNYVHDGFIRGDTLWTCEIYKGWFGVVDISDISNPLLLTTQPTPTVFVHNCELSPDSRTLFTTDEKPNAPLAAYDVSDLENITLLDTYLPGRIPAGEVHNVRVKGNFLINPSYGGQLTIVDATHPDNLIETAWDSLGTSLVWDADPYLPSGVLLASAKQEGLYLYQPVYHPASWLEGVVTDANTGLPLSNARVQVTTTTNQDQTDAEGIYKTGAAAAGVYTISADKEGYVPVLLPGITLTANQITVLNIPLTPLVVSTSTFGNDTALSVTPTVFTDFLQVNIPANSPYAAPGARLTIQDAQGRKVIENVVNNLSFTLHQVTQLPGGNYYLTLWNSKGSSQAIHIIKP